jgi:hypothetical protein
MRVWGDRGGAEGFFRASSDYNLGRELRRVVVAAERRIGRA